MSFLLSMTENATLSSEAIFAAIFQLLAGLGMLLIGFKLLSDNIEKLATGGLKRMFSSKVSKNPFVGVGVGAGATAVIQSSSATTVMIVGFVNAGLLTLFQATSMIMGANIGTTITAQIVALNSFDITKYLMLLTPIGIFLQMFAKKEKPKTVGLALAGLGLVFVALDFMSNAMEVFRHADAVKDFLNASTNPIVLLLFGAVFTAIIQSSSAITTILISMVGAGLYIGGDPSSNAILYVVLGSNIGTCITALLSSFGATTNAKRAAFIHFLFNFTGAILFFIVLLIWKSFMADTFASWFSYEQTQIAMFHTFFNVTCTLLFLPFAKYIVKLSEFVIHDKKKEKKTAFIDDKFLNTPPVAISLAGKETLRAGRLSMETLALSIKAFVKKSTKDEDKIKQNIADLEELNQNIVTYLIKLSSQDLSDTNEKYLSMLHNVSNDFYREVEIADNMLKYTNTTLKQDLQFSSGVIEQIKLMGEKLSAQFELVNDLFETNDHSLIAQIDAIEQEIDNMRTDMIQQHIDRLERKECSPANSGVFINLVSNLERAGDHLNYIAHSLIN